MSVTYLAAIAQFLVVLGLLNQGEADTLLNGADAIVSLIILAITLYGRWKAGGITLLGMRKKEE